MVRGLNAAQWVEADDGQALAEKLSAAVSANLAEAIATNGRASLVISGGSTPLPFLKALSKASLDWSCVDVTLADERWVPEDHADSNAKFVQENFLIGNAAAANFISLYRDGDPHEALESVGAALNVMAQPYSVVVLGMGGDGHTASLFPNTEGLEAALDLDCGETLAIIKPDTVPQMRISLTRAALLRSSHRYLHITGEQKRGVLEGAINAETEAPLPIASFFGRQVPSVTVYWAP